MFIEKKNLGLPLDPSIENSLKLLNSRIRSPRSFLNYAILPAGSKIRTAQLQLAGRVEKKQISMGAGEGEGGGGQYSAALL